MVLRLSGKVQTGSGGISGQPVFVVDTLDADPSNWSIVATATTDSNGDWSVSVSGADAERYHAVTQVDDSGSLKNAESLPFLTAQPVVEPQPVALEFDVTSPVDIGATLPDSAVFDDWADNKLTNRDNYSTTPYEFDPATDNNATTNERPDWSYQVEGDNGYVRATNSRLEYAWDGGSVTRVGMDNPFDEKQIELTNWYAEMNAQNISGSTPTMIWEILMENPDQRTDPNGIRLSLNFASNKCDLFNANSNSNIISASPSLSSGTWHGFLIRRDENGYWELWVDPSDPANPAESESLGTGTDTYLPDMSNGGMSWSTSHGDGRENRVRRIEVF